MQKTVWLSLMMFLVLGSNPVLAADAAAPAQHGVIVTAEGVYPKVIRVAEGKPLSLWVMNGTQEPGTVTLKLADPMTREVKKNEIFEMKTDGLASGDYALEFLAKKSSAPLAAVLRAGSGQAEAGQEIALMVGYKNVKPVESRVAANQPLTIYVYTAVNIPHRDLGIFGTETKFQLKNKQLETVELPSGLAPGTYPISRPGHPKQRHGITSRIVAE